MKGQGTAVKDSGKGSRRVNGRQRTRAIVAKLSSITIWTRAKRPHGAGKYRERRGIGEAEAEHWRGKWWGKWRRKRFGRKAAARSSPEMSVGHQVRSALGHVRSRDPHRQSSVRCLQRLMIARPRQCLSRGSGGRHTRRRQCLSREGGGRHTRQRQCLVLRGRRRSRPQSP